MNLGGIKLLTLLVVLAGSVAFVSPAECGLSNDCGECGAPCFKVDENSPPGTCVGDLQQAPNLDSKFLTSNRPLVFDFQSGKTFCGSNVSYTDWLTIANSSTGTIRTVVELDNEYYMQICDPSTCPQVFVSVRYADFQPGDEQGSLVFSVYINLAADLNDNEPQFLHTKSTNTTVFIEKVQETTNIGQDLFCSDQLTATDADTNDIITYSIIPSANFSFSKDITNQKLCIQNLSPLDRETTSNVSFILQAHDTGPNNVTKTSNLTVILVLDDINDNSPIFVDPNVSLSVHENATLGSEIIVFTATDEDIGSNAEISYSILSTSSVPFGINDSTGALYVKDVLDADDPEAVKAQIPVSYSFEIVATDGAELSTKLPVTVELIDINDNAPEFFKLSIASEFTIAEGPISSENQVITSFNVFDLDYSSPNWNGNVTVGGKYVRVQSSFTEIVNGVFRSNLLFKVDELDYEKVQDINVTFVISDGGVPALTVSTSLIIHITDVNNNPPNLTKTEFQVSEQQELIKGMVLFILRDYFLDLDSDADGNNQPGQFIQLDANPYVKVLPSVGTVQVEQQLDRETTETISFNVMIFDMGNASMNSTQMITIYLLDINDNAPIFMEPVAPFEIPEEQVLLNFGHVKATDSDAGPNGTVRYRLTGDSVDLFAINSTTGYLSSLFQLDREEKSVYELTVIAEDMGKLCNDTMGPCLSSRIISVIVTDINDNPPTFNSNVTTSFIINSTTEVGSHIGRVIATDPDTGINAVINYTLDNVTIFSIDDFGVISTVRELEAIDSGTYMLIVTAWNSENTQLNSTLPIQITILMTNSTAPTAGISETLQLYGSIALAAFILIIAIAIVSCCICCLCYHRRHTQSKNLPPLPSQTTPRKSSLKMVGPAQMSQDDDDPPINGDVPRSPTVFFSDECEVRYFSQDQLTAKSSGKTETIRVAESKFDDAVIESPQIPTKDIAPDTEEISSPPLSEDLSSGSSLSNSLYHSTGAAAAGNQYYEHPPKNHHLPLREDTLKKHNEAISENYGGHGSMLYPPQGPGRHERMYPSEPYPISNGHYPHGIVEDERNQYNSLPLPPDIQHYLSSNNRSDQSISVAVSQYVSQNGTPPSEESSPRIQFVHPRESHPHHRMHGPPPPHTSAPAVYYSSRHRPPISPHYTMDQPPPSVYYEDPLHQKAGLQHYNSSSSSNSSHNIHRPDISPPSPPPQSSRYPPPVMQNPFPRHSRHTHERPSIDGHLSPLAEYPPPSHLVPPNPHHSTHSRGHVSYTHPHSHMLPPPLYSRGSFVSEGDNDNDTVASSVLDHYLQFDTHLPRPDYLLSDAISVDDR